MSQPLFDSCLPIPVLDRNFVILTTEQLSPPEFRNSLENLKVAPPSGSVVPTRREAVTKLDGTA